MTANRHANVGELTLEEILNLPVPGGGYSVATFAEAMATVMHRGLAQITVDFKEDETKRNENLERGGGSGRLSTGRKAHVASSQSRVSPRSSSDATRAVRPGCLERHSGRGRDRLGPCPECVFWGKSDDVMLEIQRKPGGARGVHGG